MPDSFSQRNRLAGPPSGTLFRDEVPVSFRKFMLDLPHARLEVGFEDLRRVAGDVLQVWSDESLVPYHDCKKHIQNCEWFRIYEIIEGLYQLLRKKGGNYYPYTTPFVKAINEAFVSHNIGWLLGYDGNVVTRGDEVFERTIETAVSELQAKGTPTAAEHLSSAIGALSARPKANTSGAVSHATSAVERVPGEITGEAMTLGKYLDKHSSLFHPALKKGLDGVYGYASDVARHGKEGVEPTREEADFTIAVCAAACSLLVRKHCKLPDELDASTKR